MRTLVKLALCAVALCGGYVYLVWCATDPTAPELRSVPDLPRQAARAAERHLPARHPASAGVAFLAVGDWGKPLPETQRVAAQMGRVAAQYNASFVVSTGDNFYMEGVGSPSDPLFKSTFEDVFAHPALKQARWYISLGNHDQTKGTAAQVQYTQRSSRWYLPSPYYSASTGPPGRPLLDLFVLDHYNQVNRQYTLFTVQLPWLAAQLARSNATWRVVVDHRPVFSGGALHGSSPRLQKELVPILKRYGVQLVLCGDDHGLQVLQEAAITYVVSGGGSWLHGHRPIRQTLFGRSVNGFTLHRANASHMAIDVIDLNGTTLFSTTINA
eukprot:EG_transcript_15934